MAGKPVHIMAVISDRYSSEEIKTFVKESGLKMPILIDHQDEVVGYFGVILHPEVGILDSAGVLLRHARGWKLRDTPLPRTGRT